MQASSISMRVQRQRDVYRICIQGRQEQNQVLAILSPSRYQIGQVWTRSRSRADFGKVPRFPLTRQLNPMCEMTLGFDFHFGQTFRIQLEKKSWPVENGQLLRNMQRRSQKTKTKAGVSAKTSYKIGMVAGWRLLIFCKNSHFGIGTHDNPKIRKKGKFISVFIFTFFLRCFQKSI